MFKVDQRETGREDHIDENNVEASDTEDSIIKQSLQLVCVNTLVKRVELLLDSSLIKLLLIFYHKPSYKDWPNTNSNDANDVNGSCQ